MLSASRLRATRGLTCQLKAATRSFATSARQFEASTTAPATTQTSPTTPQTTAVDEEHAQVMQAPNRSGIWAPSQQPRSKAMTGPRFEQTDFHLQPAPWSAMELIHEQPVEWTESKVVVCDGGSGPHGHPRIFINTDKPEIAVCNYCGKPFANEHHREHLESLPQTSYPLSRRASL